MAGLLEHLHQFAERDVLLHRDDVGARHHDVLDPRARAGQDVREHRALFRREAGFAGDRRLEHDLRGRRGSSPVFQPNSARASRAKTAVARRRASPAALAPEGCSELPAGSAGAAGRVGVRHGSCVSLGVARGIGIGNAEAREDLALQPLHRLGLARRSRGRSRADAESHAPQDGRDGGRTACPRSPPRARRSR